MTYMGIVQEVLKEGLIKLVAQEVLLWDRVLLNTKGLTLK